MKSGDFSFVSEELFKAAAAVAESGPENTDAVARLEKAAARLAGLGSGFCERALADAAESLEDRAFSAAVAAARRATEMCPGGGRLCAVVAARNGAGPEFPVLAALNAAGHAAAGAPAAVQAELLAGFGFHERQRLSEGWPESAGGLAGADDRSSACAVLFELRPGGSAWDKASPDDAVEALDRVFKDISAAVPANWSVIASAPLDEAMSALSEAVDTLVSALLSEAEDADMGRMLGDLGGAVNLTKTDPSRVALCLRFIGCDGGMILRAAARTVENGFLLGWTDSRTVFPDSSKALEFAGTMAIALSVGEAMLISTPEGVVFSDFCQECGQAVHPLPEKESWMRAAVEAGLNPDGTHRH